MRELILYVLYSCLFPLKEEGKLTIGIYWSAAGFPANTIFRRPSLSLFSIIENFVEGNMIFIVHPQILYIFLVQAFCVSSLYVWQRAIVERQLGRNLCSNSNKLFSTGPCGRKRPEMLPLKKWPFYFVLNFFLVCMT